MILKIDTRSPHPIYEQMRNQIILGIASGKLESGESLPSVRRLAADLGVNLHTVNKAYSVLCDEGYVIIDRRKGAEIAPNKKGNDSFVSELVQRIKLAAAEARCHLMDENTFIELCENCYKESGQESG